MLVTEAQLTFTAAAFHWRWTRYTTTHNTDPADNTETAGRPAQLIIIVITGMRAPLVECVALDVDISLQSRQFW